MSTTCLVARRQCQLNDRLVCIPPSNTFAHLQLVNLRLARFSGIPSDGRMKLLISVAQNTSVDMAGTACCAANGEYQKILQYSRPKEEVSTKSDSPTYPVCKRALSTLGREWETAYWTGIGTELQSSPTKTRTPRAAPCMLVTGIGKLLRKAARRLERPPAGAKPKRTTAHIIRELCRVCIWWYRAVM